MDRRSATNPVAGGCCREPLDHLCSVVTPSANGSYTTETTTSKHPKNENDHQSPKPLAEESLGAYARDYGIALKRYFLRRGASPDLVEDMVHDVYVRLAVRTSRKTAENRVEDEIENPEAYLMQTASSVWTDFLRKKQSRREQSHLEYEDSAHSSEVFSPEHVLESRDELQLFFRALDEMTPRTRQVYLLCRMDGIKRREVAGRLGISVSAIDRHLMKAVKVIDRVFGANR